MEFIYEAERIYRTDENGKMLAEVRFPTRDGKADINSTYVDSSLRGQGVAGQLLEAAIKQIRQAGLKVIPSCSYAKWWFDEHPQESDLLL